jgi:hypothetical protein
MRDGLVVLLLVGCLAGCGRESPLPAEAPIPEESLERARALAAELKGSLMAELSAALERGTEEAIGVCAIRAPEIAAELAGSGVRIGRTSHRLRNPANTQPPWVEPLLDDYLREESFAEPRSVRIDARTIGYVEPLYAVRPCLACHGSEVAPAVLDTIEAFYPGDRATGFEEGELRGLLWVELRPTARP